MEVLACLAVLVASVYLLDVAATDFEMHHGAASILIVIGFIAPIAATFIFSGAI